MKSAERLAEEHEGPYSWAQEDAIRFALKKIRARRDEMQADDETMCPLVRFSDLFNDGAEFGPDEEEVSEHERPSIQVFVHVDDMFGPPTSAGPFSAMISPKELAAAVEMSMRLSSQEADERRKIQESE